MKNVKANTWALPNAERKPDVKKKDLQTAAQIPDAFNGAIK
jgi:hypothetical protein